MSLPYEDLEAWLDRPADEAPVDDDTRQQLQIHLLLQHSLQPDPEQQQRHWRAIQERLQAPMPVVTAAPPSRVRPPPPSRLWQHRRALLAAGLLLALQGLALGYWLQPSPEAQSQPSTQTVSQAMALMPEVHRQLADGSETGVRHGEVLASDGTPLVIHLPGGGQLRLTEGRLRAPLHADDDWLLSSGRLHASAGESTCHLATPTGRMSLIEGSLQVSCNRFRAHLLQEHGMSYLPNHQRQLPAGTALALLPEARVQELSGALLRELPLQIAGLTHGVGLDLPPDGVIAAGEQLQLRPVLPETFDLQLRLRHRHGPEAIAIGVPWRGVPVWAVLGGRHDSRQGFNLIGGAADRRNQSAVWTSALGPVGSSHRLQLQVRHNYLGLYLNGTLLSLLTPDTRVPALAELRWPGAVADPTRLSLASWNADFEIMEVLLQAPAATE